MVVCGDNRRGALRGLDSALVVGLGALALLIVSASARASAPAAADLVVRSVSKPPASVAAGAVLTSRVTVTNGGTRPAGRSTAWAYLSRDLRKGRGDRRLAPAASVPLLKPGKSARRAVKVRVPRSTAAGQWYLIVCADDTRRISERNDRNNCRTSKRRIAVVPPPPRAPRGKCSKIATTGSDLSRFLARLRSGDIGCLRGGTYTDGAEVTWTTDASSSKRITLTEYPGEQAEIVGTTLALSGDYLTVRDLTIRDVQKLDADCVATGGTGERLEHNLIQRCARHGILLHTTTRNVTVTGNFVDDVGLNSANTAPDHGIYIQGSGGKVIRNVFARAKGYGIHAYGSGDTMPHDYVIAGNTAVGSRTKAGILVECSTNCRVVNNILANNATAGITYRRCSSGCVVDTNITWRNRAPVEDALASRATNTRNVDPQFVDAQYHVAGTSPAVGAARSDFAYFPDRDGKGRARRAPDLGAYER
jgi:parallel beta-helix repeat protein